MDYRDRSLVLKIIGALLLLVGIGCAFLGPVEMYCFYLFSEGGRFHYPGFGFGSFMFANIASQIAGYYLIALVLIPLGFGHLRVRGWTRPLAEALLWFWLIMGVPLMVVFALVLFSAKDLTIPVALGWVAGLALSYPLLPLLLLRFYRGTNVRRTVAARDPNSYWLDSRPMPILVLGVLFLFYAAALHVPILVNGMVPLFGQWLSGLQGIVVLGVSIICLLCLTWGVMRQWIWAWWGSLAYFGLLTTSTLVTLMNTSYAEMLAEARFPTTEMEILQGIPLQGFYLAVFVGIPLIITVGVILFSKRCFREVQQSPNPR